MRRSPLRLLVVLMLVAAACGRASGFPGVAGEDAPKPVACTGFAAELETVRQDTLTVGSAISYPPFESLDPATQEPVGFDVDLLTEIAERTGLKVQFVNQTFGGIIAGLLARRYDVIASGMTVTPARRAQLCFSDPYLEANQALVVRTARAEAIRSIDDLSGTTVGVQGGTSGEAWAAEHLRARVKAVRSYETADDALLELESGSVDAVIADSALSLYRQKLQPSVFAVVQELPTGEHYAIAVHPESKPLLDAVNAALKQIRDDGTYQQIFQRWFGAA